MDNFCNFARYNCKKFESMKKIYLLMLVALVPVTNALAFSSEKLVTVQTKKEKTQHSSKSALKTVRAEEGKLPAAVDDLAGPYVWSYVSYLQGADGYSYGTAEIRKSTSDDRIVFVATDAAGTEYEWYADVDMAQMTVSIPQQKIGYSGDSDVVFYPSEWTSDYDNIVTKDGPVVGRIGEGTIRFGADDVFRITIEGAEGSFLVADTNLFTYGEPEPDVPDGYSYLGEGTYTDGIYAPMYNVPQSSVKPIAVAVYEKDDEPGNFLVVNPWGNYGMEFDLVVNATDPDYVLVPMTNTGFEDVEEGMTYIVSQSAAYATVLSPKMDKAEFLARKGEYNITYDVESRTVTFPGNSCFFNWPEGWDPDWFDTAVSPYPGSLVLPEPQSGIESVAVDENLPEVYYNLQGQRVSSPADGIYIKVQGKKAEKVIIRR